MQCAELQAFHDILYRKTIRYGENTASTCWCNEFTHVVDTELICVPIDTGVMSQYNEYTHVFDTELICVSVSCRLMLVVVKASVCI